MTNKITGLKQAAIKGFFSIAKSSAPLMLFVVCISFTAGCKKMPRELDPSVNKTPVVTAPGGPVETAPADTTLKNMFPFPIGAAIKVDLLTNAVYANTLIREFNSVTAENAMKFEATHPALNTFDFTDADKIVNFALKNKMRVHGHCLIWAKDGSMPAWLTSFVGDSAAFDNLMKIHIQTVVGHFKGKVASWDVVNEAFEEGSSKLKDNVWLRKLGPGYILKAFQYAHEADPDVLLFYNDYGQEFGGKKMQAMLDLAAEAKEKNIQFDGIGFQMHTLTTLAPSGFEKNAKLVAAAGLLLHVSELDITIKTSQGHTQETQAALYKAIFKAYLALPETARFGITTWGVSDKDSFYNAEDKNAEDPLLFDRNYNPKLAYKAVIEAATGK